MNTTLNQKDIILTVFCNNPFQIRISFNINQTEVAYISIWPNVAVLNDQYIKFFGQRTRQLLEIWYKLLNHFVKGYSVNTEIFAPFYFAFFALIVSRQI